MIRKIIFGVIAYTTGITIAYYSESFFRGIIQDIFIWSTTNKIQFIGKNFFIFSNKLYYLVFGIWFIILTFENLEKKFTKVLKNGILSLIIFWISLIGISIIDANVKVLECTACDDGIRKLRWNVINYNQIMTMSVIISLVPSLIKISKKCITHFSNN